MAVYQDKARERIKKGLKKTVSHIKKGRENKISEADTRVIVRGVLTELLGWDQFDNITAEYMIKGTYADLMLKSRGDRLAIIEIKALPINLNDKHMRQAKDYAVNEGVRWVILTNGDDWRAYHIEFDKNNVPDTMPVFRVVLSDSEVKTAYKAELLCLLSEEAHRKQELQQYHERSSALSGEALSCQLLSESVLNRLRLDIKADTGHKFENSEIAVALCDNVIREDSYSPKLLTALRRASKNGNAITQEDKRRMKSADDSKPEAAV